MTPFPPKLSARSLVSLLSLYGIWPCRLFWSPNDDIQLPVNKICFSFKQSKVTILSLNNERHRRKIMKREIILNCDQEELWFLRRKNYKKGGNLELWSRRVMVLNTSRLCLYITYEVYPLDSCLVYALDIKTCKRLTDNMTDQPQGGMASFRPGLLTLL